MTNVESRTGQLELFTSEEKQDEQETRNDGMNLTSPTILTLNSKLVPDEDKFQLLQTLLHEVDAPEDERMEGLTYYLGDKKTGCATPLTPVGFTMPSKIPESFRGNYDNPLAAGYHALALFVQGKPHGDEVFRSLERLQELLECDDEERLLNNAALAISTRIERKLTLSRHILSIRSLLEGLWRGGPY